MSQIEYNGILQEDNDKIVGNMNVELSNRKGKFVARRT